jgi:hypothetical protein
LTFTRFSAILTAWHKHSTPPTNSALLSLLSMSTIHTTMLSLCLLTSSRLMFHHCLSSNLSTRHVATRLILLTSSCTLTIADCYSEAHCLSVALIATLYPLYSHSFTHVHQAYFHCYSLHQHRLS